MRLLYLRLIFLSKCILPCYHFDMSTSPKDRILLVESDPIVSDLVARQALQAAGYQLYIVGDTAEAIERAQQVGPDVIIVDLGLPGLSAKDILVALSSQRVETPVIVLAHKGHEKDVIQAFRLGAADYLPWPVRETEVIAVVERTLKQVHDRRVSDRLTGQLQQTNQDLQARVRELTTIVTVGQAITSVTDQHLVFDKILDEALRVTGADLGWFLLRGHSEEKIFLLMAERGLPDSMKKYLNQAWDDGVSSVAAVSGEPVSIHGEPLRRLGLAPLGGSVLVAPIKVQKEVGGLLVTMRREAVPFSSGEQRLLEATAEYASIALVNAQRTYQLEQSVRRVETGKRSEKDLLLQVKKELHVSLEGALAALERLVKDPTVRWTSEQRKALANLKDQLINLNGIEEAISTSLAIPSKTSPVSLNDLLRDAVAHYKHLAQTNGISLSAEIPTEPLVAAADARLVAQVADALLSNAMKFCAPNGRIMIRLEPMPDCQAHFSVADTGMGMNSRQAARVFEARQTGPLNRPRRFGGLGIRLNLVKDVITQLRGKIWVESKPDEGSTFHVTLPLTTQPGRSQNDSG